MKTRKEEALLIPHMNCLPPKASTPPQFRYRSARLPKVLLSVFKDKYDIKKCLVFIRPNKLFDKAGCSEKSGIRGLEEQLIFIIDNIIDAW